MNIKPFNDLKKNLKRLSSLNKEIRVAVLSDSSSQLTVNALKGYGAEFNVKYEIFEADYNQIDMQVFDAGSELYRFAPAFVIILRSTSRLMKYFYKMDHDERGNFADSQLQYLEELCATVSQRLDCAVITNNYSEINDSVFGNFGLKVMSSFAYQLKKLNMKLIDLSVNRKDLFLLDLNSMIARAGHNGSFDPKIYYAADMVYSIDFLPYLAKNINDIILAVSGSFVKCVVLDLDNTLWGGVIGDDGTDGIQIGSLGNGKIFSELQLWLKQLKARGIILAVCSKNNDDTARQPFISHPEMELRLDDIAVFVANWENKADNIRHIQSVLNIGIDSMVFIDDNPVERALVKKEIPEIIVPDLPEDPAEYLLFLQSLNLFETASYTPNDSERTRQYQEEAKRRNVLKGFANEDAFLASLDMSSEVRAFDPFSVPRVSQLSQRSNQFNLRTIRYTEEEVKRMTGDPDYCTYSFTLKDKFGDNGLVAFVVLKKTDSETLFIENWAMSCRVLKRGMEWFTLNCIASDARLSGVRRIVGEYIPTAKNSLVKEHYPSLGFGTISENRYCLELADYRLEKIIHIKKTSTPV